MLLEPTLTAVSHGYSGRMNRPPAPQSLKHVPGFYLYPNVLTRAQTQALSASIYDCGGGNRNAGYFAVPTYGTLNCNTYGFSTGVEQQTKAQHHESIPAQMSDIACSILDRIDPRLLNHETRFHQAYTLLYPAGRGHALPFHNDNELDPKPQWQGE